MNVEETGNPARGRIKVEGGCTLLNPPNFTLKGYSGRKDKTRTTGDQKRVAACCQRSKYSWKLPDARTQSGFEFGEPLLAELPTRDTSHSCPGWC